SGIPRSPRSGSRGASAVRRRRSSGGSGATRCCSISAACSRREYSGRAAELRMHFIVGTAGHIDHGKTALVRMLTGEDTDRLKEEKERGISIDLGFARLPLENGVVAGVVDVPGHERFIRNMLAGAHGIDLALFVVAADDGPMPQSEEHL